MGGRGQIGEVDIVAVQPTKRRDSGLAPVNTVWNALLEATCKTQALCPDVGGFR